MKRFIIVFLLACFVCGVKAQSFKVQTNAAAWAAKTANIGGGLVFNEYSTLDFNFYKTMGQSWVRDADFYGMQIDYRYWLAKQPLQDFFVGLSFMPLKFDHIRVNALSAQKRDQEGSMVMFTGNFGYCWMLNSHWSLDVVYGVGASYIYYQDPATDIHSGEVVWREKEVLRFMPTNFGINLSYIIR